MRYFSGPLFLGSKVLIAACCWHKRTSNSQGPSSQTFIFCVAKIFIRFSCVSFDRGLRFMFCMGVFYVYRMSFEVLHWSN